MTGTFTISLPPDLIDAIAQQAAQLVRKEISEQASRPFSPYMTIPEAAEYLRCSRQRIDDLLSQRRLDRYKDGSRTLLSRAELEAYLKRDGGR